MEIHDRIVAALVRIHHRVRVQADNQIIAKLTRLLQEVQMTHVEQIERSCDVDLEIEGNESLRNSSNK